MTDNTIKENIWSTPNYITVSRVIMIPLIMFFLLFEGKLASAMACIIFIIASITDWLDGYLARKNNKVTSFGMFLDPLADKLMVMATMIMLIPLGRIDAWIVVLILGREIAITGLRGIASSEGVVIAASNLGKYKTGFQIAALIGLTMHYNYYGFDFHFWGNLLLWVALALTLWSGYDYLKNFKQILTGPEEESPK